MLLYIRDDIVEHQAYPAILADSVIVPMTEHQTTRALNAITSLAKTPLIQHVPILGIYDAKGVCLWPPTTQEANT